MHGVRALLLFALSLWVIAASAQPSLPSLTGRVVDNANILDAATRAQLSAQLEAHEAETSNQVVVATINSLEGYDVADYGVQLARHWGIGTSEKNNGVVLLVAPAERKVRIEVGYGLEGALPDGMAGDIIRKRILPKFRENDYPGGVKSGVNSVLSAIAGEYEYVPSSKRSGKQTGLNAIVPIIFISIVLISQVARRKFNNRRVSHAIVPGGFVGMMALIISNNPFIGIAVGLGMFGLVYATAKKSSSSGSNAYRQNHHPHNQTRDRGNVNSDGHGGFGGGGGGFGGGGGGFGGGGASGGW